ncbi:branched-chain amino acid ABC transporter permease [Halobaculum sp. CBA1158]|uniref:branched-chain amino acid ABC transporter permease n=1 Tax=Halobaculum sp. CBA1158 TaxID=2904243 RepID=UPI001F3020CA|nr:branched-chain amino acid ABC transporter permease [Halobaculum sp. CBA1158]UIP00250.1 branched-chain amino acid ABC transporter permease [Halobaculum sp. CBA1158]
MSREDRVAGDEPVTDGGTVADESTGTGSGGSALARLRDREDFVVIASAAALVVFPFLLIDVLGAIGDVIGTSIGGYAGLPSLVLIYGIIVIGFNLLLGYTGLLSFGHAAFFGSAAYSAALFSQVVPSPILMIVAGTVVATLLAWPIGFVSIRRSGVYFAVLTLTFGQALYFWALGPGSWLTNGDNGFSGIEAHGLFVGALPLDAQLIPVFDSYTVMYAFASIVMLIAIWVGNRIINSPYGLIFEALGENEERVEFVGLNVFRYKLMAFVISAVFAGVGGAMFTIHEQYIHPTTALYWIQSGDFVIMTVLGGTGSLVGPVFGALVFEYVANVVSGVSLPVIGSIGSLWRFVLGAVFVFIVWVFPRGIYGAFADLGARITGGGGDGEEPAAADGGEAE